MSETPTSQPLDISVRQKIIAALAFGSSAAEVAEVLDLDHGLVCSVETEHSQLISRKKSEHTARLAREQDSEVVQSKAKDRSPKARQ